MNIVLVLQLRRVSWGKCLETPPGGAWNRLIGIDSIVQKQACQLVPFIPSYVKICKYLWCSLCYMAVVNIDTKGILCPINTALLTKYKAEQECFHSHMVLGHEVWFNYHEPESKFESMERRNAGSSRRKVFKITRTATELMTTVFCDSEGVTNVDYLHIGMAMNR